MLMWLFRVFVIGVLTLVVGGVMALFGEAVWWLALVSASMLYFGEAWVLKRGLTRLVSTPFQMKGAVLAGAGATVHRIEKAERPEKQAGGKVTGGDRSQVEFDADGDPIEPEDADEEDDDDEEGEVPADHRFYRIEVTITPVAQGTKFTHWEPGDLAIVNEDAPPEDIKDSPKKIEARRHRMEIWDGAKYVADEGMKYGGPQRLRVTVSAPPALRRGKFRYYFEDFGAIDFGGAR